MSRSTLIKLSVCVFFIGVACLVASIACKGSCHRKTDLTIVGYINTADGLGRQSAELIHAFKDDLKINFVATQSHRKELRKNFRSFMKKKGEAWGKVVLFHDSLWRPGIESFRHVLSSNPSSIRIAYSMWESSSIPPEWVYILNTHFDAVVVPAPFLVDVYKRCGVQIPLFELPFGLDLSRFLKEPLKTTPKSPLVFGNLALGQLRKNQLSLIRAFAKAFGNASDVYLRINVRAVEPGLIAILQEEVEKLGLTNTLITNLCLSAEEYLDQFKKIDCYVSPSKGEGFSIQPREAMALGIPVIATNNTGQEVICGSGLVRAVSSTIQERAIYPWGSTHGYNYNCSVDDLAEALLEVKNDYAHYLSKGKEARDWTIQYDYESLKKFYRQLISPTQVTLGETNQINSDGIVTSSPLLYDKYRKAIGF